MKFSINGFKITDNVDSSRRNTTTSSRTSLNGVPKEQLRVLYILAMVVFLGIILFNVFGFVKYLKNDNIFVDVDARIVGNQTKIETEEDSDGYEYKKTLYAPVYEYVVDGKTYRHESSTYQSVYNNIGTMTVLKYNPNNPSEVMEATGLSSKFMGVIVGIAGLIAVIIAYVHIGKGKNESITDSEE